MLLLCGSTMVTSHMPSAYARALLGELPLPALPQYGADEETPKPFWVFFVHGNRYTLHCKSSYSLLGLLFRGTACVHQRRQPAQCGGVDRPCR